MGYDGIIGAVHDGGVVELDPATEHPDDDMLGLRVRLRASGCTETACTTEHRAIDWGDSCPTCLRSSFRNAAR